VLGDQGSASAGALGKHRRFVMQTVALSSFPAGEYELEVTARDRLTRAVAKERRGPSPLG
jgi:hypothetical protein